MLALAVEVGDHAGKVGLRTADQLGRQSRVGRLAIGTQEGDNMRAQGRRPFEGVLDVRRQLVRADDDDAVFAWVVTWFAWPNAPPEAPAGA